jgi:hypothetical protein
MSNSPNQKYRPPVLKRDHARPRNRPAPGDAAVEGRLAELVSPQTYALAREYHRRGLRARLLTLPVMLGLVLALIWRQVPSVAELVRALAREPLLWTPPLRVSEQAVNQRLRCLPAELLAQVFAGLLPTLHARAAARTRPVPGVIARVQARFPRIRIVDATTLEEVFRKVGGLQGAPAGTLAGKLLAVLDLPSKLPVALWLEANPAANEKGFLERIKATLSPGTLVVFDRGFYAFPFFDWLTDQAIGFVSRAREVGAYTVVRALHEGPRVRDCIIELGRYRSNPCAHPVRLVEVQIAGVWHRYLTNVLDPALLSTADVVLLYGYRWRIEEAFSLTKRLLGLAYLWTGAFNGVALQVWATWLLYAVLVDLSDAVAQQLDRPLDAISLEMVYRGLYHFTVSHARGLARDPVAYLAAQDDLGIVKRRRPARERQRLDNWPDELNL